MTWFYPDCQQCGGRIVPEGLDRSEEWMGWLVWPPHCEDCGMVIANPA